jgi:phosphatidylinositol glycan class U
VILHIAFFVHVFLEVRKMSIGMKLGLVISLGLLIRVILFSYISNETVEYLSERIEVMSILTSFRRISEGRFLVSIGMDPYSSNYFRLNPILSSVFFPFIHNTVITYMMLVICDLLSTCVIAATLDSYTIPAAAMFFLNPYAILSELGLSGQSAHILVMSLLLFSVVKGGKTGLCTLWLGFLIILKPVVPLALVFPIALILRRSVMKIIALTLCWIFVIVGLSFVISGSWSFLSKSLLDPILVSPDLEPNMGFAWCLFSMMFPASLPLFRIVFHLHLFVLMYPVYLRFSKSQEPCLHNRFLMLTMTAVILFQLYPTCIDYCMFFALMFACNPRYHDKISTLLSQTVIAGLAFTSVTGPLWIERNMGNGNFLFVLSIVTAFLGTVAVGHSLTIARLEGYLVKHKKSQ